MMLENLLHYAEKKYQIKPEYLWAKLPEAAVLRNPDTKKWFALFMKIEKSKLGLPEQDSVWIVNLKCDPLFMGSLLQMKGYFPAYHMSKTHWISILLDGTVDEKQICNLLDMSYQLTGKRKK